jgi:uncharacterized protein (TIGR04141 family)
LSKDNPKFDLNIYLLKDTVDDHKVAINKISKLKSEVLKDGTKQLGIVYTKRPYSNPPKWASFFSGYIDPDLFGKNASTAALLAITAEKRNFILSFGQGRHSIDSQYVETNFGLRVTLNLVDPASLRSIDKASFETHPRQSREQVGKATELQYFGVDVERDLLRAVTGRPLDSYFGERVSGMDSLKLSLDIGPAQLGDLLSKLLKEFKSKAYRSKGFAFVDHIGEVKDLALLETLDDALIEKMQAGGSERIWMAVPELVDWDKATGFKYSTSANAERVHDVRIADFIEQLNGVKVDKSLLLRRKIYCVDADHEPLFDRPAYYYIYAELILNTKTYLLNNGKWYLIENNFVKQINDYYASIARYTRALPAYEFVDKSEGDYNKRVAENDPAEFVLLDKKNISVSAAVSPVEPCDLYRAEKEFIHVKRYGGSSLFSHLFNQGLVSGELFKREKQFRELLNQKLPQSHKLANPVQPPDLNEFKVVYAIVSESDEELSIPFFSRISLRHAVLRLTEMGYRVEVAKISVTAEAKLVKVLPTKHPKIKKPKAKLIPA